MDRRARFFVFLLLFLLVQVGAQQMLAQPAPDNPRIHLRTVAFDPLAGEPSLPAALLATATEGPPSAYLVQFAGPVKEDWKAAVRQAGAQLYGYIPDYAFIARVDTAAVEQVRALPFVRWVGPYHPAYRLAPDLAHTLRLPETVTETVTITVQTFPDADLDALAAQAATWGGAVEERGANATAGYLRMALPTDRLSDLAMQGDVLWVEPYFEPALLNDVGAGTILRTNQVRATLGLFGSGQIVAVADTGLDVGTTGAAMSDDFEGRIVQGQALCGARGLRTTWNDLNGHGTHVSGSVLGNGTYSASNPGAHNYSNSFAGVAPEARLVFQSIDSDGDSSIECIPTDLSNGLFAPAYDLGARIHSDSWGGPTGGTNQNPEYGGYTTNSQQADATMWQHRDLLLLFAAGNSGTDANADGVVDPDSLGSPGTAKNVMTVGASENSRPQFTGTWGQSFQGFPAEPIASDRLANNPDGMAAFSSRGPTDDGRIKPDLVAPGTWIISARSHDPSAGTGWGVYNQHYVYMGGTSMATPLTAGAAALAREWLIRMQALSSPSAALIKAVLLNGAADMSPGQYGTGSAREIPAIRPNRVTGWGRVDLVDSLTPPGPRQIWLADNSTGLATGATAVYTLTVGTPGAQGTNRAGTGNLSGTAGTPEPPPASVPLPPGPTFLAQPPAPAAGSLRLFPPPLPGAVAPSGPAITEQLIQNGGFETNEAWYGNESAYTTGQAHSGNRSVTVPPGKNGYFFQTVAFPADAQTATLTYWWKNLNPDEGLDTLQVFIYDETRSSYYGYGPQQSSSATGWQSVGLDLSTILATIRGRSINVLFSIAQDSAAPHAAFYVDDVALSVERSGTSTPTATATRTATPGTATPTATSGGPGSGRLRITLAWTDYPGEPAAGKALVNDLDLEVIGPDGSRYSGNQGLYATGHACLRSGRWDACNNVEGLVLPHAQSGIYRVIVRGAQIAQGGQQPFALVASGDHLREAEDEPPTPTPTRTPGSVPTSTPTSTSTPTPSASPTVVGDLGRQTIRGTVRRGDTTETLPIAGAVVRYTHFSLVHAGSSGQTTTDANGTYAFDPILLRDTDTVRVRVEAPGFEPQQEQRSGVESWNDPVFDFALTPIDLEYDLYLPVLLRNQAVASNQ